MAPKDGTILNGYVWIAGEPMAMDHHPDLQRPPKEIVEECMADQVAYIARLQLRVDKMRKWLEGKP